MLSPFAPLYLWLKYPLAGDTVSNNMGIPIVVGMGHDRDIMIDLRDLQTRVIVLHALANAGHSRPWALGSIWSPLTDEQAGRVCAEIVRAVGENPSKPVGVVPVCVLGKWPADELTAQVRPLMFGDPPPSQNLDGVAAFHNTMPANHSGLVLYRITAAMERQGGYPKTRAEQRQCADAAARVLGCIMIEDVTP